MHGKKIYPVIKDGGVVKNFTAFSPSNIIFELRCRTYTITYSYIQWKRQALWKIQKRITFCIVMLESPHGVQPIAAIRCWLLLCLGWECKVTGILMDL